MNTPLNRNRSQTREGHSEQATVPVAPERAGLESVSTKGGIATGVSSMASVIGMGLAAQSGSFDGLQAFAAVPTSDDALLGSGEKSLLSNRAVKPTAEDAQEISANASFSQQSEVHGESLSSESIVLTESEENDSEASEGAEILVSAEALEDVAQIKEPKQNLESPDEAVASEPVKVAVSEVEVTPVGTQNTPLESEETDSLVDKVSGDDGLVGGVVETVLGDDGLVGGVVDTVLGDDGLVGGVVDTVLGDDGLVGGVVDTVLGDDGLVGGLLGDEGLLGGLLGGSDEDPSADLTVLPEALVSTVSEVPEVLEDVVETVLGDDGLVGGVVDTVLGDDGLVGGLLGDEGLLGGLLGGSDEDPSADLTVLPEALVSTVSEVPEVLEDVVETVLGDDGLVGGVVDTVLGDDGLVGGLLGDEGLLGGLLGGSDEDPSADLTVLPEALVSTVSEVPEVLEDVVETVLGDDGLVGGVVDTVLGDDGLVDGLLGDEGLLGGLLGGVVTETTAASTTEPEALVSTVSEVPEVIEDIVDAVVGDDGFLDTLVGQTEFDALLGLGGEITSLLDASEPSLLDGLLGEADVFGVDVEESAAGADDLFIGLSGGDDLSGSLVDQGVVSMSPDGESYAPDAEIDGLLNNILGGGVEEIFGGEGTFAELFSHESDAETGAAPEEAADSNAELIDDVAVEDALNILFEDSADHHVGSILGGLFGSGADDDIG